RPSRSRRRPSRDGGSRRERSICCFFSRAWGLPSSASRGTCRISGATPPAVADGGRRAPAAGTAGGCAAGGGRAGGAGGGGGGGLSGGGGSSGGGGASGSG